MPKDMVVSTIYVHHVPKLVLILLLLVPKYKGETFNNFAITFMTAEIKIEMWNSKLLNLKTTKNTQNFWSFRDRMKEVFFCLI